MNKNSLAGKFKKKKCNIYKLGRQVLVTFMYSALLIVHRNGETCCKHVNFKNEIK